MGRAMHRSGDESTDADTADAGRFINAVVTVPADGLGDFYSAVADWHERYEEKVRGRAMRGRDEGAGEGG